jgi:hypothetical protein
MSARPDRGLAILIAKSHLKRSSYAAYKQDRGGTTSSAEGRRVFAGRPKLKETTGHLSGI